MADVRKVKSSDLPTPLRQYLADWPVGEVRYAIGWNAHSGPQNVMPNGVFVTAAARKKLGRHPSTWWSLHSLADEGASTLSRHATKLNDRQLLTVNPVLKPQNDAGLAKAWGWKNALNVLPEQYSYWKLTRLEGEVSVYVAKGKLPERSRRKYMIARRWPVGVDSHFRRMELQSPPYALERARQRLGADEDQEWWERRRLQAAAGKPVQTKTELARLRGYLVELFTGKGIRELHNDGAVSYSAMWPAVHWGMMVHTHDALDLTLANLLVKPVYEDGKFLFFDWITAAEAFEVHRRYSQFQTDREAYMDSYRQHREEMPDEPAGEAGSGGGGAAEATD